MNETADICLTVTDGPVIIRGLGSAAVDATHTLWDCIVASERFPSGAGASGASYVVTLKKGVDQASEVRRAEDDLTKALLMLAAAWPFSGGSYLTIETREVVCSPRFESNAAELERRMLEQCGIARVASTASVPLSWCATYSQPPLCLAVRIARLMHSDFHTRRVLLYHQRSVTERAHRSAFEGASWFISLYKVRDFLCKLYGSDRTAKLTLGITDEQWRYFGKILNNNDLRHAEIWGRVPQVSNDDINNLYALARSWVSSYLRTKEIIPAA